MRAAAWPNWSSVLNDLSADSKAGQSTAPQRKIRIGDLLVSNGVITEAQLMAALMDRLEQLRAAEVAASQQSVADEPWDPLKG